MRAWLVDGALSFLVFLPVAVLAAAPFFAVVFRRYRYAAPGPTLAVLAGGLYASALFSFTTFPLPSRPEKFCVLREQYDYWRLTPFASFAEVLDRVDDVGLVPTLTSGVFLQVFFNIVFFVPLGFFVAYVFGRNLLVAAAAGLATSLLIEVSQGSALWGLFPCPYRVAEVDDLITNTSGALVGWGFGMLVARRRPWRRPEPRSDVAPARARRRVLSAALDLDLLVVSQVVLGVLLVTYASFRGVAVNDLGPWPTLVAWGVGVVAFLVVPLVRRDRATLGQLIVLLGLTRAGTVEPAPVWSVVVRFLVRWLPVVVWGWAAAAVVLVVEGLVIWRRADDRSLASVLARAETRTHDSISRGAPRPAEGAKPGGSSEALAPTVEE